MHFIHPVSEAKILFKFFSDCVHAYTLQCEAKFHIAFTTFYEKHSSSYSCLRDLNVLSTMSSIRMDEIIRVRN